MDMNETVCFCMGVTVKDIADAVKNGANTFAEVSEATGAGTGCGTCEDTITELIKELKNQ